MSAGGGKGVPVSAARLIAVVLGLAIGCAGSPPPVAPGEAALWGRLRLVPREGVPDAGGSYGDRRLRDVARVDYSRPGFAVLYVDTGATLGGRLDLAVVDAGFGPRIEPAHGVVGLDGWIDISNRTDGEHVVSAPSVGLVRKLAPGGTVRVRARGAGEIAVHVVDGTGPGARLFVAPGPWAVADAAGRYGIGGLVPGEVVLRTWHPRFPPTQHRVALVAGEARRIDVAVGVDLSGGAPDAP